MKRVPAFIIPLTFSALSTIQSSAYACSELPPTMFLKVDGIQGESEQRQGEIDILSWGWTLSQSNDLNNPIVRPISLVKCTDIASAPLINSLLTGQKVKEAVLTNTTFLGSVNDDVDYLVITMTDVTVSTISNGGAGGQSKPTESFSLNFNSACVEYIDYDTKTGIPAEQIKTCWTFGK